ncbi:patatin-like phospholipase family protein [Acinetobacter stercoris]|uniref:Patatin-like phospholipase n=1 Tax=Acinetobacter stercoris TaxID=2126983 RepID=A0A2U3MZ28_9GAMM|nr:patatin-like phospholipase family protein [Acinetobacter stercoris]SPL70692.1 Patatin-like phospholipase [Acinetobacter stercoris]
MSLIELIKSNVMIHGKPENPNSGYIQMIKQKITETPISDIVDDQQHQYVDLVLEGGGVLGIALIGYTYVLEQAGIRFLNIAGTSAGAINAMLLASVGYSHELRSEQLLKIFEQMELETFVDGGFLVKKFVQEFQNNKAHLVTMIPKAAALYLQGKFNKNTLGLNPGDAFEQWLGQTLDEHQVSNTEQLLAKLKNRPLKIRDIAEREDQEFDHYRIQHEFKKNKLAIIATEVKTESKIIFPKMGYLFWDNPMNTHPKKYVRASMSIPLFFEPCKIKNIPRDRQYYWETLTGFRGTPPEEACLVDGGVVSNFPIDVFHHHEFIPLCPTFGVKLGVDRTKTANLDNIISYLGALFDTARHTADYSFLLQNADYEKLIAYVDTSAKFSIKKDQAKSIFQSKRISSLKESESFSWLDFNMSDEKKVALFELGAKAAYEFIVGNVDHPGDSAETAAKTMLVEAFDWNAYKNIRKKLRITLSDREKIKMQRKEQCSL